MEAFKKMQVFEKIISSYTGELFTSTCLDERNTQNEEVVSSR